MRYIIFASFFALIFNVSNHQGIAELLKGPIIKIIDQIIEKNALSDAWGSTNVVLHIDLVDI